MYKTFGTFKGTLMLVLLMLIATRLTWLQTSETTVDLSSTFYRTGLWFNDHYAKGCLEPPEATFPLPAAMTLASNSQPPPPPSLGELSPGLAAVMVIKCKFERLDTDALSHWNAWLYLTATLFSAIAVRLFTNSWTAGLLAAFAVLSRGTLQNRALYASSEPYAAVFIAGSWCFFLAFLRSLWRPWLVVAYLSLAFAVLFVPALWMSLLLSALIPTGLFLIEYRRSQNPLAPSSHSNRLAGAPFTKAQYDNLTYFFNSRSLLTYVALGLVSSALFAYILKLVLPGSVPSAQMFKELSTSPSSWSGLLHSFTSIPEIAGIYISDVDWHAWLTVGLIAIQPLTGGPLAKINRLASIIFAGVCGVQVLLSVVHECYFIHTTTQAQLAIVPVSRLWSLFL